MREYGRHIFGQEEEAMSGWELDGGLFVPSTSKLKETTEAGQGQLSVEISRHKEGETMVIFEDRGSLTPERWNSPNDARIISVDRRILQPRDSFDRLTVEEVNRAVRDLEDLDHKYFVPVGSNGHTRCVDGRGLLGYDDSKEEDSARALGPQVAGGTAGAALSFRIAVGFSDKDYEQGPSFEADVADMTDKLFRANVELGGHIDDHATGENTGCGAIDKAPEILENIAEKSKFLDLKHLVRDLMGEKMFDKRSLFSVLGNARHLEALQQKHGHYFGGDEWRHKVKQAIQKKREQSIEKLSGKHNEAIAIVNFVPNTTFHRDRYSARHGNGKIQAFNYDVWRSLEIGYKLGLTGEKYQDFITSRIVFTIGTLMTLTDGSLRLVVRRPE